MKRRELIVIIGVVTLLLIVNAFNFIRRERLKGNSCLIVKAGRIQLSLNAVSAGELENLPGIGPVIAERIVAYRQQTGGFGSLDELKKIKGIGDKLYEKIIPYLKL